tara:strand:- start:7883 stop:9082 length:1200 start_codon:yes stop_codon:yes gene_type:complete
MNSSDLFGVDPIGLKELIGGAEEWRHAVEIVANVFDEYKGYVDGRKRPTYCKVTFTKVGRKNAELTVTDDGAGFDEISDVWTFFRSTSKRSSSQVSGRFNAGEKHLLAVAHSAVVVSNGHNVVFADGKRKHTKTSPIDGTVITVSLKWNFETFNKALEQLKSLIAPEGLEYTVNGERVLNGDNPLGTVRASLPTVILSDVDGMIALRKSTRKCDVTILKVDDVQEAWLYELGVPVCELSQEFPYSLNVGQKIPLPISRDVVDKKYVDRLIGEVIQAAPDILNTEHSEAEFLKPALEFVQDEGAVVEVANRVFGDQVRWSSNVKSNGMASVQGVGIIPSKKFGKKFTARLNETEALPTSLQKYGSGKAKEIEIDVNEKIRCPKCNYSFDTEKVVRTLPLY